MPLSEESIALLALNRKTLITAMSGYPIDELREVMKKTTIPSTTQIFALKDVEAPTRAGSVTVRIYRPSEATDLPVLMYLHGGGFAIGDLDFHDEYLRQLSNSANIVVASVDYRLAPEHPYPAGLDDCMDVWSWLQTSPAELVGDVSRLGVAGDSAGGALSFALAQRARDEGNRVPKVVVTAYGTTDMRISNPEMGSRDNSLLTAEDCEFYWQMYAADPERRAEPYCNPAKATDLKNLGTNLVITAEYDPTRDATEAYAKRLSEAGNLVTLTRYDGELHGFFAMPTYLSEGRKALAQTVAFLDEHL